MNEENRQNGLTLNDFLFLIKQNIVMILVVVILFTAVGTVYGLGFKKTTYTATVTAMVDARNSDATTTTTSDYQLSYLLAQTYAALIKSEPIMSAVVDELSGYDITMTDISDSISVITNTNSLIIEITAKASTEELAKALANTTFDKTVEAANKVRSDNTPLYGQLYDTLKCVDHANSAIGKRGASIVIVASFLIGAVVSLCIILIRYLLNDTYTSKEEFEKTFNIHVLSLLKTPDNVGDN